MALFGGMNIPMAQIPNAPEIKTKGLGGLLGGNKLAILAGILGDTLTKRPTYSSMLAQQRQQQQEDDRWNKRFNLQSSLKSTPTPSTASKMAAEIGLKPGTPQYQDFIRRYAFKPTILSIGNAMGGEDRVEYDPSGMTGGLPPGYNPDEWEVVE